MVHIICQFLVQTSQIRYSSSNNANHSPVPGAAGPDLGTALTTVQIHAQVSGTDLPDLGTSPTTVQIICHFLIQLSQI
jgi:hypothetical protein